LAVEQLYGLLHRFLEPNNMAATEKDQNLNFPLDQLIDHVAAPID